jgi:hypothetical protein
MAVQISLASLAESPLTYRHFRVVEKDGKVVSTEPVSAEKLPQWAKDVSRERFKWPDANSLAVPFFAAPIPFVIPPAKGSDEPFYNHNHCPALTWCDNGDLLAIWFSTKSEEGVEMTILASRLRAGAATWDPASEFFKATNRNMTGSSLFNDGKGTLYHFNGMGPEGVRSWDKLALLMRTSTDNGVTWSVARPISSGGTYALRHQVIAGTLMTQDGTFIQPCDGHWSMTGPSAIHISRDRGLSWRDAGGDIRGIHAGVTDLMDERLLAFGRGQLIDGRMPQSASVDMGKTWTYKASPFPPISGGQRLVLKRLKEGALLLVSFTSPMMEKKQEGMTFTDKNGREFTGYGMFAAISFDDGETWPVRKLLTPGKGEYDGGAWTGRFTTSWTEAESGGYLAATQTPDNMIHLVSSRLHYCFNVAWIKEPNENSKGTENR